MYYHGRISTSLEWPRLDRPLTARPNGWHEPSLNLPRVPQVNQSYFYVKVDWSTLTFRLTFKRAIDTRNIYACSIITSSSAVANMLPERLCTSYSQHCVPLVTIYWLDFPTRSHSPEGSSSHMTAYWPYLPTSLPFDGLDERDPLEQSGSYLLRENWNGWTKISWRSHDDRLRRLGTIHQRDRHTDSHVAIAINTLMCCVWPAKTASSNARRIGRNNYHRIPAGPCR